jgi:molybdopterin molybdotransferase
LKDGLISVAEARERLLRDTGPSSVEILSLDDAQGRVLAQDLLALRTQPPDPVSAMDGYAVRAEDISEAPAQLRVIGQAAAGHPFDGDVGVGETVRIFTGGVVPQGADTILIQENATSEADGMITANQSEPKGRYVRPAGLDFSKGEIVLKAGSVLDAGALCLSAAANHPSVTVFRQPRVAVLATGDELLPPGSDPGPGEIIASNSYGVSALATEAGAVVIDLGIARDNRGDLENALNHARDLKADVLVTLGGASVGDHDLVQDAFLEAGMTLDFWRIAMRPGKPLMLGQLSGLRILGLPGNPVSSLVCSHLFLKPLIEALGGREPSARWITAKLASPLPENDRREDYMRGIASENDKGEIQIEVFGKQDSSMIRVFAEANVLVKRPVHAPAAAVGEDVTALVLKSAHF